MKVHIQIPFIRKHCCICLCAKKQFVTGDSNTFENSELSCIDFIKSPKKSHGRVLFGKIIFSDKKCFLEKTVNHL